MAEEKGTNNDLQNITHTIKDRVTGTTNDSLISVGTQLLYILCMKLKKVF